MVQDQKRIQTDLTQQEVDVAAAQRKAAVDQVLMSHLEETVIILQARLNRAENELAEWRSGKRKAPAKKAAAKKAAAKAPGK